MEHALHLDRVTRRFGEKLAVDHVSLTVPRGCIYGFLGQNGAGKTTTLRMIMGIFLPDEGTVNVLGHGNPMEVRNRLGYLPEEKGLYKKMRTAEIIAYFGRLKGLDAKTARMRAHALLERYAPDIRPDQKCESLSKGMGQKVQILGTLVHEPELVVFDEPFSGLDPVNVKALEDLILEMKREGRTVLFSTHVMEQAEKLCDYIVLIHKGRKMLDGTLAEVRSSGDQAVKLDYDGDGRLLGSLPGVRHVSDSGKTAELFLEPGADPQAVLAALVGKVAIRRFDLREPSLQEVFLRTVEGAA
jgi:ABC-2 type transport system ATP-binding protein